MGIDISTALAKHGFGLLLRTQYCASVCQIQVPLQLCLSGWSLGSDPHTQPYAQQYVC